MESKCEFANEFMAADAWILFGTPRRRHQKANGALFGIFQYLVWRTQAHRYFETYLTARWLDRSEENTTKAYGSIPSGPWRRRFASQTSFQTPPAALISQVWISIWLHHHGKKTSLGQRRNPSTVRLFASLGSNPAVSIESFATWRPATSMVLQISGPKQISGYSIQGMILQPGSNFDFWERWPIMGIDRPLELQYLLEASVFTARLVIWPPAVTLRHLHWDSHV